MLLIAVASGAQAQDAARSGSRELIYGAELMTSREREAYRKEVEKAGTGEEQAKVRERHRERLRERARTRGARLAEPDGVLREGGK
jgi:hypothetical protein